VAGALLGVLVGGVVGRLAMMLLARLNPNATGVTSDDGFIMGQFTLSGSLQLLLASWQLGMVGAGLYAMLRGLLIGPRWFRVLSISVGPGVVVGATIVHTAGVDFVLLKPLWLTVGLFVAIPLLFAGLLTMLAERWIGSAGWFAKAPLPLVLLTLVLWLPVAPLLLILAVGWTTAEAARRWPALQPDVSTTALQWMARGVLVVAFAVAVADLIADISSLS
jgi:hypothetical protein